MDEAMKHTVKPIVLIASLALVALIAASCTGASIPGVTQPAATTPAADAAAPAAGDTAGDAAGDAASDAGEAVAATSGAAEEQAAGDTAGDAADTAVPAVSGSRVVADAKIVPATSADLSMSAGGIVKLLSVQEGDAVEAGQVLVQLDDAQQQVGVAQAQANLQRAQANLAQLQAGARTEELAQAEAGLAAAEAAYARVAEAAAPGSIAAAQASVAQAQAGLQQVLEGPSEEAMIAAKANLKNAEAQLRNATSAYNRVKENSDIGMRPESLALEQATIAWESAKAQMADLENGATPATIAAARAGVNQALVQLDTAQKSLPNDVAAAQASVEQAKAQLALIKAGARPEAVQIAEADVAAAVASLQQALVALGDTELRAPFGGVVATVNTALGEQVAPGAPLILIADTSSWEIETSDLTEFDVVGIRPGDRVSLTFDAIPDLELPGVVSRIRPIGEDNRGDTVYKVVVTPEENDPRLLWNMTAVVEFGGR
jgi:HlyD family secretion protein